MKVQDESRFIKLRAQGCHDIYYMPVEGTIFPFIFELCTLRNLPAKGARGALGP